MAEERELLKYELDISDVEAKAAHVLKITEEISKRKAAGQDAGDLQEQLDKELTGLAKLGDSQKKAAGGAAELLKHKEKLASVVGLVGGQFGETAGRLGGLIEMLLRAGPAAAATAAALALVTVGVNAWRDIEEGAKRATAEVEKFNAAVRERNGLLMDKQADLAKRLEELGARSPENIKAATGTVAALGKEYGFEDQRAREAAALATAMGGSTEDAAVLATMLGAKAKIADVKQARQAIHLAKQTGSYSTMLTEARRPDPVRTNERIGATVDLPAGSGERPTTEAVFEWMRKKQALPEDATFEEFKKRVDAVAEARTALTEWRRLNEMPAVARGAVMNAGGLPSMTIEQANEAIEKGGWLEKLVSQAEHVAMGGGSPPANGGVAPGGQTPGGVVINQVVNRITTHIAQQHNAPRAAPAAYRNVSAGGLPMQSPTP